MKNRLVSALWCLPLMIGTTWAEATRWFEAEIIIFEQKSDPLLREDFSFELKPINNTQSQQLLINQIEQQQLNACLNNARPVLAGDALISNRQVIQSVDCPEQGEYLSGLDRIPVVLSAEPFDHMDSVYLLAPEQLQFNDVMQRLKNQGLKPLLHTGWRFPEEPEKRAPYYRVLAGKKLENAAQMSFIEATRPSNQAPSNDLLALLLVDNQTEALPPASTLWQIDGQIQIYVQHYLFINAQFNYLENNAVSGEIQSAYFEQFRRVYSGDVHYLDHPKFGLIIQIRKFKH